MTGGARAVRGSMRAFLPTLRKLEGRLGVPMPARLRILRELEYDLEQLRRELESQGMSPEEAEARALEALVPEEGALLELDRLHRSRRERWAQGLGAERLRMLERGALIVCLVVTLAVETWVLLQADLLSNPSPFLWPVLGLGAAMLALIFIEGGSLWATGAASRLGHSIVLAVVGLIVATGVVGALFDAYSLAEMTTQVEPGVRLWTLEWVAREAALLAVALVLALTGGLAWYLLENRHARLEGARQEVLGLQPIENEAPLRAEG